MRRFLSALSEILMVAAVLAAGFLFWQTVWTGVESKSAQDELAAESGFTLKPLNGKTGKIAPPHHETPPLPDDVPIGQIIGELHIPRFGARWARIVVQGTGENELNRHGIGHYEDTAMPGQVGLYALAGHRAGYGEPLAYINTLQPDDPIVMKTKDHWFVYRYYDHKIVDKSETHALNDVPFRPGVIPHERLMALTSCEPRYAWTTAQYRWVSYAKLDYWANVNDGVPRELAEASDDGTATGANPGSGPLVDALSKLPPIPSMMACLATVYLVLFMLAAIIRGWPVRRSHEEHNGLIVAWFARLQPGGKMVRALLDAIIILMVLMALLQWGYPFLTMRVPFLAGMSAASTL